VAPTEYSQPVPFLPLALEEWHARYEQTVTHNLADSGVPAVRLAELLPDPTTVEQLRDLTLGYPPVSGTTRLRELIAEWAGADPAQVLVTVGAAEALSIALGTLVGPGEQIVVIEPGYRHISGLAVNRGIQVSTVQLDPTHHWRLDPAQLDAAVDPAVRLISVTNPSNPLGTVLTEVEMTSVVRVAEKHGAWLLADEVYRGSEHADDQLTPSFIGRYHKVISVGSLSKSFGLPGLRLGWLIAPVDLLDEVCRRHEYATIAASTVSMHLAEAALEPGRRTALLRRGRDHIRTGYARLQNWIAHSDGVLSVVPPRATAMAFVQYHADAPSIEVAHAIRTEVDALVGVGAHFGGEGHLRIGHTVPPDCLDAVLPGIIQVVFRYRDTYRAGTPTRKTSVVAPVMESRPRSRNDVVGWTASGPA
jgi:aspartate/methionine/tyrosine aminotransferase